MEEILDQTVPGTSNYADGRLRGVSLRAIARKARLLERLTKDLRFRDEHRGLFEDLRMIRQESGLYRDVGLRAPRRRR